MNLTRDGKYAVLYEELDSVVRFLSLQTNSIVREYWEQKEYKSIHLSISDDLKYIVTTSWIYLEVWEYDTNEKILSIIPSIIDDTLISKDNQYIFTESNYRGSLIDIAQGKEIYKIWAPDDMSIAAYRVSDNGEYFAYSFSDLKTIIILNLNIHETKYVEYDKNIGDPDDFYFSSDSKYLIVKKQDGTFLIGVEFYDYDQPPFLGLYSMSLE